LDGAGYAKVLALFDVIVFEIGKSLVDKRATDVAPGDGRGDAPGADG
jgi:hypothetical protein